MTAAAHPVPVRAGGIDAVHALARRTLEVEWPKIRAEIDAGRLPLVGLIRHRGWSPFDRSKDHQVLAYGYEADPGSGDIAIRMYDPNWPDRDEVTIVVSTEGFRQPTGEGLGGLIGLGTL